MRLCGNNAIWGAIHELEVDICMESLKLTSLWGSVRASERRRGQLLTELHAHKWIRKMRKNAGSPN